MPPFRGAEIGGFRDSFPGSDARQQFVTPSRIRYSPVQAGAGCECPQLRAFPKTHLCRGEEPSAPNRPTLHPIRNPSSQGRSHGPNPYVVRRCQGFREQHRERTRRRPLIFIAGSQRTLGQRVRDLACGRAAKGNPLQVYRGASSGR